MREILFRGKRVDNGEWIYGVPVFNSKAAVMVCGGMQVPTKDGSFAFEASVVPIDVTTICQYVGLNDKYGQNIFEGDVVYFGFPNFFRLSVIKWDEEGSRFIAFTDEFHTMPISKEWEYLLVGNVYDSPTIMEVDDEREIS